MTYQKRPKCRRCLGTIRKPEDSERFLLPSPCGAVKWCEMHLRCVILFNELAVSKAFDEVYQRKRKAHLRTQGVYVA